ncbi:MAG: ATP-binding protein [Cellulosilyticaceae bacterium]
MKRNKITNKLFLLISLSLIALLGAQMLFQTLYLEDFYTYSKKKRINEQLWTLSEKIQKNDEQGIANTLLQFSQDMGAATTIVDFNGKTLYGLDTQRAFVEIKDNMGQIYKIYIDGFINNEEVLNNIEEGLTIGVSGFATVEGMVPVISPRTLWIDGKPINYERGMIKTSELAIKKISDINNIQIFEAGIASSMETIEAVEVIPSQLQQVVSYVEGIIQNTYIPNETTYGNGYRETKLMEEISLFLMDTLESGKAIWTYEPIIYEKIDSYVGMNNVIGMMPMILFEEPVLLVTMISLQGMQESIEIMNQYATIIFCIILSIALFGAYTYAKRLTTPLVQLRNVTTNLANLDFSTECVVNSNDEIGELATNINTMSFKLKDTLEKMQKELKLKEQLEMQRKQLIADVSHELKTPLTVLKANCSGLIDGIYDGQDQEHYQGMLGQIDQMSYMVQELLDISRLENEATLKEEVFMLSDVILKVHRSLKTLAQEKELNIDLKLEEYFVRGERTKIETVIRNLYNNAIFHTPEGENIQINISRNNSFVEFEIINTGITISEEVQIHLWEPFYKIDQSRHKIFEGSGLGLYIVKQILEKHKSEYGMFSEKNKVHFYFKLEYVESL